MLVSLLSIESSGAAESITTSPRSTLDRMLHCDEEKRTNILDEQRTVQAHLTRVEAFRATLSPAPIHRRAVDTTEQALRKDRDAIAKLEAQLAVINRRIALTTRAISHLQPKDGGNPRSFTNELQQKALTTLSNATRCGQPGDATYVTNQTQLALLATDDDVCSQQIDDLWGKEYGYVKDPVQHTRLEGILAHLQVQSPRSDRPLAVRILRGCQGRGATATATTIYFEACELKKAHSDDELMFIAAHELAHVQLNHPNQYQVQEKVERALSPVDLDQLVPMDRRVAQATAMPETVGQAWMSRFNTDQELEADQLGAQLALAAGASPRAIHDAFARMAQERDDEERTRLAAMTPKERAIDQTNRAQKDLERLTTTHPEPEARIKALEATFGEKFWEQTSLQLSPTCLR